MVYGFMIFRFMVLGFQKQMSISCFQEYLDLASKIFGIWLDESSSCCRCLSFPKSIKNGVSENLRCLKNRFPAKHVTKIHPKGNSAGSRFQKKSEIWKVPFDCTFASRLHVSARRGMPKVTQNHLKNQIGSKKFFFQRRIREFTENVPQWVSKWVFSFLAGVPWAPLEAPLVPQPLTQH